MSTVRKSRSSTARRGGNRIPPSRAGLPGGTPHATFIRDTGAAKGAEVEAVGMARAKAYKEQVRALGRGPTALVNSVDALSRSGQKFVPNILVVGGGGQTLEGLAAQVMGLLDTREEEPVAAGAAAAPAPPPEAAPPAPASS